MNEKKTLELKLEELEERIAPIVDPFLGNLDPPAGGVTLPDPPSEAGGAPAAVHVFGHGPIDGAPVPQNTPGTGPA